MDELEAWAAGKVCPACGQVGLVVEYRLDVKPLGSWSLSGHQMKASAREWPWLVCPGCGVEARGH